VCFCVSAQTQNTPNVSEKTKRLIPHQICAMQIKFIPREREKKKTHQTTKTRDVSQCGLAIYIKKYLKAKEELWNLKYFTIQKYINLQKIP
jgi:hypothetical protein